MTTPTSGHRARPKWPLVLLIVVIIMLVPATREFVLTWIVYAIAAAAGMFVAALLMLGKPPRR